MAGSVTQASPRLREATEVLVDDAQTGWSVHEHATAATAHGEDAIALRAFPVVCVRRGSGFLVDRQHRDVGEIEPGLLDRWVTSPRSFKGRLDRGESDEIAVVESEERVFIDHPADEAEILLLRKSLELVKKSDDCFRCDGHSSLLLSTSCASGDRDGKNGEWMCDVRGRLAGQRDRQMAKFGDCQRQPRGLSTRSVEAGLLASLAAHDFSVARVVEPGGCI